MDSEVLIALQGSIEKYNNILEGHSRNRGSDDCHLCHMFLNGREPVEQCKGCPVAEATGNWKCYDTPYYDMAHDLGSRTLNSLEISEPERYKKAKDSVEIERAFLVSLLPKDELSIDSVKISIESEETEDE